MKGMKAGSAAISTVGRIGLRPASFEDGAAVLRVIEAALERGCRDHYTAAQQRAVFLTYAETIFIDLVQPLDSVVAEGGGAVLGFAQLDPGGARLRALFVAPWMQGRGLGRALLAIVERLAVARQLRRIQGAMSLNAVPFYLHAGFQRSSGPDRLMRNGVAVPIAPMEKTLDPAAGGQGGDQGDDDFGFPPLIA
jgi:GNAT superfamily N-acetyltransferase